MKKSMFVSAGILHCYIEPFWGVGLRGVVCRKGPYDGRITLPRGPVKCPQWFVISAAILKRPIRKLVITGHHFFSRNYYRSGCDRATVLHVPILRLRTVRCRRRSLPYECLVLWSRKQLVSRSSFMRQPERWKPRRRKKTSDEGKTSLPPSLPPMVFEAMGGTNERLSVCNSSVL